MKPFGQIFEKKTPPPFGSAVFAALVFWLDLVGWMSLLLMFVGGFLAGWFLGAK